jgi:hypothetical protein
MLAATCSCADSPFVGVEDAGSTADAGVASPTTGLHCTGDPDSPGGVTCQQPDAALPSGTGSGSCTPDREFPGSACDPCVGRPAPNDTGAIDKKVLFFAPANYHYGVNQFATALESALTTAGYDVTLVTTVDQGVEFDECNLYRSFKQIWLFLPCNNQQRMDEQSFQAIKKVYEWGSAIVLLTDNHYFAGSNPNTHCNDGDWPGQLSHPSDAVRVAKAILKIGVGYTSYDVTPPPAVNETHPLAQLAGQVSAAITWPQLEIDDKGNPHLQYLPLSYGPDYPEQKMGRWAGLIEVDRDDLKRLALVLTPVYCYHCPPQATSGYDTFYRGVADYFEKQVSAADRKLDVGSEVPGSDPAGAGDQGPGTDPSGAGDPSSAGDPSGANDPSSAANEPRSRARPSEIELWADLLTSDGSRRFDKHRVAHALHELALRRAIDFDQVLPFLEHDAYYVRHHAVMAMGALPHAPTVVRLRALLPGLRRGRLALGIVRSLAAQGDRSASAHLAAALPRIDDPKVRREIIRTLGRFGADDSGSCR